MQFKSKKVKLMGQMFTEKGVSTDGNKGDKLISYKLYIKFHKNI